MRFSAPITCVRVAVAALAWGLLAAPGSTSTIVARDATAVRLEVDGQGRALVTYQQGGHAATRPGLGRDQRPDGDAPRLLRRLAIVRSAALEVLRRSVTAVRRPQARLAGHGTEGARRLVLGPSALAPAAAQPGPSSGRPARECLGASSLALARADSEALDLARLDRPGRHGPSLRPVHVPRQGRVRSREHARRQPARSVRPKHLPRHAKLAVRARMGAGEPRS